MVAKNNFGFFGLIPVFVAFKIFNKPNKNNEELEKILKKACDFDEEIHKYNINELNKNDLSIFVTEIQFIICH